MLRGEDLSFLGVPSTVCFVANKFDSIRFEFGVTGRSREGESIGLQRL